MDLLDQETNYTHSFGNRQACYYGVNPYSYSGITHYPNHITRNKELKKIFDEVKKLFPKVSVNSAMIQRYRDECSGIPPHADNEEVLDPASPIISLSLGQSRNIVVSRKGEIREYSSTLLSHGDRLIMSGESQHKFEHSIPAGNGK